MERYVCSFYKLVRYTLVLLSYIEEFAKRNDIDIEYKEGVKDGEQLGDGELDTFIGRVSPQSKGKTLQIRDYQMDALDYAIRNNRSPSS